VLLALKYRRVSMEKEPAGGWRHVHPTPSLSRNEQRTRLVVLLTLVTMVGELLAGWWSRSMSLTADGWHMGSHAAALGVTLFGYWFARSRAGDSRYSFGTGKVFSLSGFASGILLAVVGILVAEESLHRLLHPEEIRFDVAIGVATVGLLVNLGSAWLLGDDESGEGAVGHGHGHGHGHDHNLRAAYLHVMADALTSLLAILALVFGRWLGWVFLDALIGIVGGAIILKWSISLCRESGTVLLDVTPSTEEQQAVRGVIERLEGHSVVDLHIWEIGLGTRACMITIGADTPKEAGFYRGLLRDVSSFSHLTIEVGPSRGPSMGRVPTDLQEDERGHSHGHSHHNGEGH
jgi:cation diffusion facilitator family transporter